MNVIYIPSGRAREYSPLALNLYSGCVHGCKYCFSPSILRKTKEDFHREAKPRKNILELLEKDARKLRGDDREILLSFASDPYPPIEMELGITREAIKILMANNLRFTILTKGGTRATRDFDLLTQYTANASFGTTLIFTDQNDADKWEPNAPSIRDRIQAIKEAHGLALIRTWISLEPVIDPVQALKLIEMLWPVVDHWKIGKINYHPEIEKSVDWIKFREDAKALLDSIGANYYFKKSLTEWK